MVAGDKAALIALVGGKVGKPVCKWYGLGLGFFPNIPRSAAMSWPFGQRVSATTGGLAHDGDGAAHESSNPPPPRWLASRSAPPRGGRFGPGSPKSRQRGGGRVGPPTLGRRQ